MEYAARDLFVAQRGLCSEYIVESRMRSSIELDIPIDLFIKSLSNASTGQMTELKLSRRLKKPSIVVSIVVSSLQRDAGRPQRNRRERTGSHWSTMSQCCCSAARQRRSWSALRTLG
jgi:hypothetical protein